jgi:hypothetical protein
VAAGKIGGNTPGTGGVAGPSGPDARPQGPTGANEPSEARSEGSFADKLGGAKPAGKASAGQASGASPAGLTGDLAAELQAGRITPKAALERVIDRIVDKQVGTNAPAAVREKVRAALEDAVADDPLLAEKIKSLGA